MKSIIALKNIMLDAPVGTLLRVRIDGANTPTTRRSIEESKVAYNSGLDLRLFTGPLEKVWYTANGDLCFTMKAKERIDLDLGTYCYRTFNIDSGNVVSIHVDRVARFEEAPAPRVKTPTEIHNDNIAAWKAARVAVREKRAALEAILNEGPGRRKTDALTRVRVTARLFLGALNIHAGAVEECHKSSLNMGFVGIR